jgi:hypothetical protein
MIQASRDPDEPCVVLSVHSVEDLAPDRCETISQWGAERGEWAPSQPLAVYVLCEPADYRPDERSADPVGAMRVVAPASNLPRGRLVQLSGGFAAASQAVSVSDGRVVRRSSLHAVGGIREVEASSD